MKRLQYAAVCLTFATSVNAAAPSPPQNLVARELFRSCVLNWDVHADATVSGYRVYRAIAPGGPYDGLGYNPNNREKTEYVMPDLTNGTSYYLVVTAVNADGESGYSNEVEVVPTDQCAVDVPYVDGSWWRIGENAPDVTPYNTDNHNACDFTIWLDSSGTWHCVACIRSTSYPGSTRFFHEWTGDSLTQTDWTPQGIFWTTGTAGEPDAIGFELGVNTPYTREGRLQAPHCFKHDNRYYMFHNNAGAFCLVSDDGATFTQMQNHEGGYAFFGMGRDVMIFNNLAVDGLWYAYFLSNGSSLYDAPHMAARTASVLEGPWSGDPTLAVHTEGNPESPFAYRYNDRIYLWEQGTVFQSHDAASFHGDPVTIMFRGKYAPEIIEYNREQYVAGYGNGIWVAKVAWYPPSPTGATPGKPVAHRTGGLPQRSAEIICDLRGRRLGTEAGPLQSGGVTVLSGRGAPRLMVPVPGRL